MIAALAAARSTSRLAAIAALGAVGYGISLLFVFFGAPDLALTQFAIETLTVILFVLVIYRLPRFASSVARARARGATPPSPPASGPLMAALVLVASASPLPSRLAAFFAAQSPDGGARPQRRQRDPRRLPRPSTRSARSPCSPWRRSASGRWSGCASATTAQADADDGAGPSCRRRCCCASPPATSSRCCCCSPLYLLLRGHNAPGGGFVGGLTAAAAFALYLLAFGTAAARQRLRADPHAADRRRAAGRRRQRPPAAVAGSPP